MRPFIVIAIVVATAPSAQLGAQQVAFGAGVGIGAADAERAGLAGRLTLTARVARRFGIGVDAVFVSAMAVDTGSSCGAAGCDDAPGRLRDVLQFGLPVLSWRSASAPGVGAWISPYWGRWIACSSPAGDCGDRPALDAGVAGGVAVVAVVGSRRIGMAARLSRGAAPSLTLGGGQGNRATMRPTVLALLLTLES